MAKVAIIIPCREIDDYAKRCIEYCNNLEENIELWVIPDSIIPGLPSKKRNWAMSLSDAEIFAFLDSDAYPSPYWLKTALRFLKQYPAVCGPGVLPPDAPFEEKVADKVHQWMFCPYRVVAKEPRMVPWFPTFNLIVRREVASQFDEYLTGEDDRFGIKIKGGIYYHPDILVYHNRRGIFKPLWKQFGQWGKTKGHFARLAFIAWITTLVVYAVSFVRGFFKKDIS